MLWKVWVMDLGDIDVLFGMLMDIVDFKDENYKILIVGGIFVMLWLVIFGIIKVVFEMNSFLLVVLFQEMIWVLIDVVICGKNDLLIGFKENVIIGKIIFVGIGMLVYCYIKLKEVGNVVDGVYLISDFEK